MNDDFKFSPDTLAALRGLDLSDPRIRARFKAAIETEIERSKERKNMDDETDIIQAAKQATRELAQAGFDLSDQNQLEHISTVLAGRFGMKGSTTYDQRAALAVQDLLTEKYQAAQLTQMQHMENETGARHGPEDYLKLAFSRPAEEAQAQADEPDPNKMTAGEWLTFGLNRENEGAELEIVRPQQEETPDISKINDPNELYRIAFSPKEKKE